MQTIYEELPVVDSEWDDTFGPAPLPAILYWEQISLDRLPNGPRRENPAYIPGLQRRGFPVPAAPAEKLMRYRLARWLTEEEVGRLLLDQEVFVERLNSGELRSLKSGAIMAFTSLAQIDQDIVKVQRIAVRVLRGLYPDRTLSLYHNAWEKLVLSAAAFPEVPAADPASWTPVDEFPPLRDPRYREYVATLEQEARGITKLVERASEKAKGYGSPLTVPELMAYARGLAVSWSNSFKSRNGDPVVWPENLHANGLIEWYENDGTLVPSPWAFGKASEYYAGVEAKGLRAERMVGAYVGFALGEAVGLAAEAGRFADDGPLRWGGLTRQLLSQTESVMRGFPGSYKRGDPVPASLPPARPDSWLAIVAGETPPAAQEFSSLLTTALAASITDGDRINTTFPIVPQVAGELIGSAAGADLRDSVLLLATVLTKMMSKKHDDYPMPLRVRLQDLVKAGEQALQPILDLRAERLGDEEQIESLGDGRSPSSVLNRALLAATKRGYDPRVALTLAMNQSSSKPITCALVGALLGSRLGIPDLPPEWLDSLEDLGLVHNMAEDAYWHFRDQGAFSVGDQKPWNDRYPEGKG